MVSVGLRPLRSLSKCQVVTLVVPGFAAVTVAEDDPVTELSVAEIVVVPVATAAASPEALMVATEVAEEAHVAVEVTLAVEPSL